MLIVFLFLRIFLIKKIK